MVLKKAEGVYTCIARNIRDPEKTKLIQENKIQHNVKSNLKSIAQA